VSPFCLSEKIQLVHRICSVSKPCKAIELNLFGRFPSLRPSGFRLWDLEILEQEARSRQAPTLPSLGGVEYLAQLLASPHKPIVAVVRGRQEFGPRALGHRSLLAVPDTEDMKHRMNRLKFRKPGQQMVPKLV